MLESSDYLTAMSKAPPAARAKLAKLHRIAKARERVQRVHHPASVLWSDRGDVEAVAGLDHSTPSESSSWSRFLADGIILVDSAVLGERVVVRRDASVQVPARYADLSVWTLDELRRVRDSLRGGPHRFDLFESINRVKREMGGTLVGTSNALLSGVVVRVESPGSPLTTPCHSPGKYSRCTSRIPAGAFTAWVQLDGESSPRSMCLPCAMRYPWTPEARRAQRAWFNEEGPQL